MLRKTVLCTVVWLAACQAWAAGVPDGRADNWHRWRGPEATGVAPTANPPITWDENTNIKWKVAIAGRGSGSPVVWGDKIFLLTAIKTDRTKDSDQAAAEPAAASRFHLVSADEKSALAEAPPEKQQPEAQKPREGRRRGRGGFGGRNSTPTTYHQFVVICIDRNTGVMLWEKTAAKAIPHEGHHATGSFASSAPVTDGKNLYVSFGSRGIYSYDLDGNVRWKKDLGKLLIRNNFGEGASPALYGNTLIVNWDHEGDSFITALDANTGDTKWKVARDEETTWLTPLIVEHQGIVQVIVNGMNRARGYDLATGEVLWECGGQARGPVPTAVANDNLVFCTTGHRGSALYAIPLNSRGDITGTDKISWSRDSDTPYVPTPILYGDSLYYTKSNTAILTCVAAATGKVHYKTQRLPGLDTLYASPVGAAGRIYFAGRNGNTLVVKHGPKFEVLAENKLDGTIDATPAVVGNTMFIRTDGHLYCIAE